MKLVKVATIWRHGSVSAVKSIIIAPEPGCMDLDGARDINAGHIGGRLGHGTSIHY